jgi:hypothetical protein
MENTQAIRQDVVWAISWVTKMLTGKGIHYNKRDDDKVYTLVSELLTLNIPGWVGPSVPIVGFTRYVYEIRIPKFHQSSVFYPGLVHQYSVYCQEQAAHIRARVHSQLQIFEFKKGFIPMRELLYPPRHDIGSIVRWCLALRNKIPTENQTELNDTVIFDLMCYPWYYEHLDLLPELKVIKGKPLAVVAKKFKRTGKTIKVKVRKKL